MNSVKHSSNLRVVIRDRSQFLFENYDRDFKIILLYPGDREFQNEDDLNYKIAEFHNLVLKLEQYALLYKVHTVKLGKQNIAGTLNYLIAFEGTVSSEYLSVKATEIVNILIILLESFFTCIRLEEFSTIYFELNQQIVIDTELFEVEQVTNWQTFKAQALAHLLLDVTNVVTEVTVREITIRGTASIIEASIESSEALIGDAVPMVGEATEAIMDFLVRLLESLIAGLLEIIGSLFQ